MFIQSLEIQGFRNLNHVQLDLHSSFNILYGANGSGKTSFLESIFFLSSGRSFRARSIEQMVQQRKEAFFIFCQLKKEDELLSIGTQRDIMGNKRVRVGGQEESSYLAVARNMPVLLINTEEHCLVSGTPEHRRQFMNWGMFHVEHDFYFCWQRLQQIIKQRNAVLRHSEASQEEIKPWDAELLSLSSAMHSMRKQYVDSLTPYFSQFVALLLPDLPTLSLFYYPGWNKEGLEKALARSFYRDCKMGYTQYGPHRADLMVKVGECLGKDVLSRGQQKLVVYALRLAQGLLLQECSKRSCIYLIDDFIAELDKNKRRLVCESLKTLEAQVFVSGVEKDELLEVMHDFSYSMFHVEHGEMNCCEKV
jgi:DNA replication and repair protein RecF